MISQSFVLKVNWFYLLEVLIYAYDFHWFGSISFLMQIFISPTQYFFTEKNLETIQLQLLWKLGYFFESWNI